MTLSAQERALIFVRDGLKCRHCGTTENLRVDHIWPRVHGGRDEAENLQTLCRRCNLRKGSRVDGLEPPHYVVWPPVKPPLRPTVAVPVWLIEQIKEYRDAFRDEFGDRISVSEVVRRALDDFLGRELAKSRKDRK